MNMRIEVPGRFKDSRLRSVYYRSLYHTLSFGEEIPLDTWRQAGRYLKLLAEHVGCHKGLDAMIWLVSKDPQQARAIAEARARQADVASSGSIPQTRL